MVSGGGGWRVGPRLAACSWCSALRFREVWANNITSSIRGNKFTNIFNLSCQEVHFAKIPCRPSSYLLDEVDHFAARISHLSSNTFSYPSRKTKLFASALDSFSATSRFLSSSKISPSSSYSYIFPLRTSLSYLDSFSLCQLSLHRNSQ